jgi:hypothetical protein
MLRETQSRVDQQQAQARAEIQQQINQADEYALALLTRLDKNIAAFLNNVRQSIDAIQQDRNKPEG